MDNQVGPLDKTSDTCTEAAGLSQALVRVVRWQPYRGPNDGYDGVKFYDVWFEDGRKGLLSPYGFGAILDCRRHWCEAYVGDDVLTLARLLLPEKLRDEVEAILLDEVLGFMLAEIPFRGMKDAFVDLYQAQLMEGTSVDDESVLEVIGVAEEDAYFVVDLLSELMPSYSQRLGERRALVREGLQDICGYLLSVERSLRVLAAEPALANKARGKALWMHTVALYRSRM